MAPTKSTWYSSYTPSKLHSRFTYFLLGLKRVYTASFGESLSRLEALVVCALYILVVVFGIDLDKLLDKIEAWLDSFPDDDLEQAGHLIKREKPYCEKHASHH